MDLIQTEKFSDTYILIRTLLPLTKEVVTKLNILIYMMRARTEKFDTKQKLSMALNSTYGMSVAYGLSGYGKQVALDIRFKYIREDFIQKDGYVEKVVDIMDQVLHHSVLNEATLKEAKYLLKAKLTSQQDDPDSIAIKNALEKAQKDHEISIQIQGYMDEIDPITVEDMKSLYKDLIDMPKLVLGCGSICQPVQQFLETIKQTSFITNQSSIIEKQDLAFTLESKDISQASLIQVYADHIAMDEKLYYPLLVMNSMLGQCPMNLLFEEVREKKSYCYSISSNLIRFDGALVIMVGTNKENIEDVQRLIQVQIDRLIQNDVDKELMNIAKSDLIDMIQAQHDQASSMIEQKFLDALLKRSETSEERIEKIRKVTMEEVQQVAKQLDLVSVSIVEENDDEI